MQEPYQLGIDVWEGQLEIDEAVLKASGVKFMFIRLNDMNGGHHMDENFTRQWAEAAGFYRAPYFVYNPWLDGQMNFDWLNAHMPAEASAVALDVEVVKSGYSSITYAAEFNKFYLLCQAKWNTVIYTGQWFLNNLSTWVDGDYWWAQYPYALYPSATQNITWDEFRAKLIPLTKPSNALLIPGDLRFWQCTADRYILPGSNRPLDVNVFWGDESDLALFFNKSTVPSPVTLTSLRFSQVFVFDWSDGRRKSIASLMWKCPGSHEQGHDSLVPGNLRGRSGQALPDNVESMVQG